MKTAEHAVESPMTEEIPPDSTDSMLELRNRIQLSIGNDLACVNQILDRQLKSPHRYINDVLQHTGRFRGKQIRPILLLLCHKSIGGHVSDSAHTLAAVVEMIHTATLVHDDILDDASCRRHMPTINRTWNTETSVLSGDYLFSRGFRLAASSGDAIACELIGQATDLTCAGELHQISAGTMQSKSERDYFRVIRGKTGQLFGLSCHLGARSAQATRDVQRQMQIAGLELGMAFQIADDVLDLTGKKDQTGKDCGNDLANHRLTLPVLRALQLASSIQRRELNILLDEQSADGDVSNQRRLINHSTVRSGILSAEQTARQLVDRFLRRLKTLPDSEDHRLLELIAQFAVRRCV